MRESTLDEEKRFWAQVDRRGALDACWEWRGRCQKGYGRFMMVGRSEAAHRVAYALTGDEIPVDQYVTHTYGNRACCNPAHLRLVTKSEYLKARHAPSPADRQ